MAAPTPDTPPRPDPARPAGRGVVSRFRVPDLGVGVGFRIPHFREITSDRPEMDWFEVISENFMIDGGSPRWHLDRLLEAYPVVPHGVSANLGGTEDPDHTRRLRALVEHVDPPWVSDHLCWNDAARVRLHDLLPLPYTEAVIDHVVDRVKRLQDQLGRPFAVENASSYATWKASEMPEWAFVAEILERADCAMLLDVNNVFVSACNHGFDAQVYLDAIPADRVVQIHLAGHTIKDEGYRLDTHDGPVCDEVWALYRRAIARIGSVTTLVEWDDHIPPFARLQAEAALARAARDEVLGA
jgi:uncharacterized protein (UPF0276 family)